MFSNRKKLKSLFKYPFVTAKKLPLLNNAAFTLIELLVVVLIIGILAAIALPQYQLAVLKSRTSQALSVINSITSAQKIYYLTNGKYAAKMEDLDINLPRFTYCGTPVANILVYKNDMYQFLIDEPYGEWSIGRMTGLASCAVKYNGPVIMATTPGGYFNTCPSTSNDICLICLAGSGDDQKRNRQVCEALGGRYLGIFNTNSAYQLN
jgi:prepilin-type N-terminal cleavage/methylation domain-containing protein